MNDLYYRFASRTPWLSFAALLLWLAADPHGSHAADAPEDGTQNKIAPFTANLSNPNPNTRRNAIDAIGTLSRQARDPIALREFTRVLIHALTDEDQQVKTRAMMALQHLAIELPSGNLKDVISISAAEAVIGGNPDVRRAALALFSNLILHQSTPNDPAIPLLNNALKSTDAATRIHSAGALASLASRTAAESELAAALEVLDDALKDETTKILAAETVVTLQPGTASIPTQKTAINVVQSAFTSSDPAIRRLALDITLKMGPQHQSGLSLGHLIPHLAAALKESESRTRFKAAEALLLISHSTGHQAARDSIAQLTAGLEDKNNLVRAAAAETITRLAVSGKQIPALKSLTNGLTARLADSDGAVRRHAAEALTHISLRSFNRTSQAALEAMTKQLTSADAAGRFAAAELLMNSRFAPSSSQSSEAAIEPLIAKINDQDPGVRAIALAAWPAILTLQNTNLHAQSLTQSLGNALTHEYPQVRAAAVGALTQLACQSRNLTLRKEATELLLNGFKDNKPEFLFFIAQAARGLPGSDGQFTNNPELATALIRQLDVHDPKQIRPAAAEVLGSLGLQLSNDAPLASALVEAVRDPDVRVRLGILHGLRSFQFGVTRHPRGNTIASAIVDRLEDDSTDVRRAAASFLGTISHQLPYLNLPAGLAQKLSKSLTDGTVAGPTAAILAQFAANTQDPDTKKQIVHLLVDALKSNEEQIQIQVADSLNSHWHLFYDPAAAATGLSALVTGLNSKSARVQGRMAEAISRIPIALEQIDIELIKPALPLLLQALKNPQANLRRSAAAAAAKLISPALEESQIRAVVAALVQELADNDPRLRQNAAASLGSAGSRFPNAELFRPAAMILINLTRDEDPNVRAAAVEALGGRGLIHSSGLCLQLNDPVILRNSIQAIEPLLTDEDSRVRIRSGETLVRLISTEEHEMILEKTWASLQAMVADPAVTREVVDVIGSLAFSNAEPTVQNRALPILLKSFQEGEPETRVAALESLENQIYNIRSETTRQTLYEALLETIQNDQAQVRLSAIRLFSRAVYNIRDEDLLSKMASALIKSIDSADGPTQEIALQTLSSVGFNMRDKSVLAPAIPIAMRLAKSDQPNSRRAGIQSLPQLTQNFQDAEMAKEVLALLITATADPDQPVRFSAVNSISGLLDRTSDPMLLSAAVQALEKAVLDHDFHFKTAAVNALGEAYLRSNRTDAAIEVFKKAIAEDPLGGRYLKERLARAYEQAGRQSEADKLVEESGDLNALNNRLHAHAQRGNLDPLMKTAAKLLISPSAQPWHRQNASQILLGAYRRENKLDQLATEIEQLQKENPKTAELPKLLAQIHASQQNNPKAIELYLEAQKLAPRDAELMSMLGNLYHAEGMQEQAAASLRAALNIQPGMAHVYPQLARVYLALDQPAEITKLAQALALQIKNTSQSHGVGFLYGNLGEIHSLSGDHDAAIDAYKKAAELEPVNKSFFIERLTRIYEESGKVDELEKLYATTTDPEILNRQMRLQAENGELDKLLKMAERVFSAKAEPWQKQNALFVLLDGYSRQQKLADLAAIFEQKIKAEPQAAFAYKALGQIQTRQQNSAAAIRMLEKAIELQPQDDDSRQQLGDLYLAQSQFPKAIALFREALKRQPGMTHLNVPLATALARNGQIEDALKLAAEMKAQLQSPRQGGHNNAYQYASLGDVYLETKKPEEAIESFQKAIELEPRNDRYFKSKLLRAYEQAGKTELAAELRATLPPDGSMPQADMTGKPAPEFLLSSLDGKEIKLSDYKGKVVLLDFWASWCPPCVQEAPHFVALTQQFSQHPFAMIGISIDHAGRPVIERFARTHKINFPILLNQPKVQQAYGGIPSIPTTFLIDAEGVIRKQYVGYRPKQIFESDIKQLLAAPYLHDRTNQTLLVASLKHESAIAREIAAERLAQIGATNAIQSLKPLLADPSLEVQKSAALALGSLFAASARTNEAIQMLKAAIKLAPADPPLHIRLGDLLRDAGSIEEASEHYDLSQAEPRKQIASGQANAHVLNELAWFYVGKKVRTKESLELAQKAVALAPDHMNFVDTLGWAHLQNGQLPEAVRSFTQVFLKAGGHGPAVESSWRGLVAAAESGVDPAVLLDFAETIKSQTTSNPALKARIALLLARSYSHHGQKEKARELSSRLGIVPEANWWILGPLDNPDGAGFAKEFIPESAQRIDQTTEVVSKNGNARWAKRSDGNEDGFVDFDAIFNSVDAAAAYAWTTIHSPTDRDAELRFGSDDQAKVWMNGKLIFEWPHGRPAALDQNTIPIHLNAGENQILVKVCDIHLGWGFYFRITNPDGIGFPDLKFAVE